MKPSAVASETRRSVERTPNPGVDTRHLGLTLRNLYAGGIDTLPITDTQVDLLLRLRQKERDLRRSV